MAPRDTENTTYAKFSGDKQRALWYVMVFSAVVNTRTVYSMRLLCSFFRLKEKWFNYVVTFFLKMQQTWVGRTTLNGEKNEDGPSNSPRSLCKN